MRFATKFVTELECEERLKELDLTSLMKRRETENMIRNMYCSVRFL